MIYTDSEHEDLLEDDSDWTFDGGKDTQPNTSIPMATETSARCPTLEKNLADSLF